MKKDMIYLIICLIVLVMGSIATITYRELNYNRTIIKNSPNKSGVNENESPNNQENIKYVKIPYAKKNISSNTQLSADLIGTIEVPETSILTNMITDLNKLIDPNQNINYCVASNTNIPETSYFYQNQIEICPPEKDNNKNEYSIKYSEINSYFKPDTFFDLYLKASINSKLTYGILLENCIITKVEGQQIFFKTVDYNNSYDLDILINKVNNSTKFNFIPILKGEASLNPTTKISSRFLADLILKEDE